MIRFTLNKVLQGLVTVLLLSVIVFIASRATGDPLALLQPSEAGAVAIDKELLRERLGLDGSYIEQYFRFLGSLLQGDLGRSFTYNRDVWDLFVARFPNTLALILPAFAFAGFVGIPLGVITAKKRGTFIDKIGSAIAVAGVSVPNFWLGLVLILVFSVSLGLVPSSRMGGFSHYILPVVTTSTFLVAGMMRLVRSSMLEQLSSEYVKLARTKGVTERAVTWRHALRNSLLASVSFAGTYASLLVGGSVAVETVFSWPGVGRLLYEAVISRDYPLAQGLIVLTGLLIVFINMMTDFIYMWLDPRIR